MASTAAAPQSINPRDFLGIDLLLSDEDPAVACEPRFVDRLLAAHLAPGAVPRSTLTRLRYNACRLPALSSAGRRLRRR